MAKLIDGTAIADEIVTKVKASVDQLAYRPPGLAFVIVGDNAASQTYIRMKKKRCAEVGIFSFDLELGASITQKGLLEEIDTLNANPSIDGILVQLPLPSHLSEKVVIEAIAPEKDVDGFHPLNLGKLLRGDLDGFLPCTPFGVATLLQKGGHSVEGKHVVIVGRSNIVGKPLAALLMQKRQGGNATVTVAHSKTEHLSAMCRSADILVAAMGNPRFIKKEMVKEGAVVVDVGINREGKSLVGDVDFENVAPICSAITPVPGGVGPMTIAMLLSNTLLSYQRH